MKQDSKVLIWSGLVIVALIASALFIVAKTKYDPTVSSTVVTAIVATVIGFVAAYIGARATLRATQEQHRNNLELQRQSQNETVRGVVQAIHAELKSLLEIYSSEYEQEWEKYTPGDAFWSFYPISQNYFTIFENNSAVIGLIPDDAIRTSIVRTYLHAKGLVDSHLYNNRLLEERDKRRRHYMNVADPEVLPDVRDAVEELRAYGDILKSSYIVAKDSVFQTIKLIESSGMLVPTSALPTVPYMTKTGL
jgi:hypothetical protein